MNKIIIEINPNYHEVVFNYSLNDTEIKFNGKSKLDLSKFELNKPIIFKCPHLDNLVACDKYDHIKGELLISCNECARPKVKE